MPTPKLPIGCGMHRARRNRKRPQVKPAQKLPPAAQLEKTWPPRVTVRLVGSTYIARCEGWTASCTSAPEFAAQRAAIKRFMNGETAGENNIRLLPESDNSWWALTVVDVGIYSENPTKWRSASEIVQEQIDRMSKRAGAS